MRVPAGESSCACISGLVDIEDTVERSKYGIKGRIDATVRARFNPAQSNNPSVRTLGEAPRIKPEVREVISPLEFKTGRPHFTHQAQVFVDRLHRHSNSIKDRISMEESRQPRE